MGVRNFAVHGAEVKDWGYWVLQEFLGAGNFPREFVEKPMLRLRSIEKC